MVYVFEQILYLRDEFFFANQKQFFNIGLPWKSFKKNLALPTSSQELAVGLSVGEGVHRLICLFLIMSLLSRRSAILLFPSSRRSDSRTGLKLAHGQEDVWRMKLAIEILTARIWFNRTAGCKDSNHSNNISTLL